MYEWFLENGTLNAEKSQIIYPLEKEIYTKI